MTSRAAEKQRKCEIKANVCGYTWAESADVDVSHPKTKKARDKRENGVYLPYIHGFHDVLFTGDSFTPATWRIIASMMRGLQWPTALTIGPDDASMYALPSSSQNQTPSARAIIGNGTLDARE